MRLTSIINSIVFSLALAAIAFALLRWAGVSVGALGDWLLGGITVVWLVVIVSIPWNLHFQARKLIDDAGPIAADRLPVRPQDVSYARRIATITLVAAVGLHVATALALLILNAWNSNSGWATRGFPLVLAVIAMLLALLRPAIAAYDYVSAKLGAMSQSMRYPREDVVELRSRLAAIEPALAELKTKLDPDQPDSISSKLDQLIQQQRADHAAVQARVDEVNATNSLDHDRLSRETRSAISQLSSDSQFLEHAREIIRFFKSA